jgi:hypothetical protein
MRLLNIKTFQLETFFSDVPEYAALSHTWGDEEVNFQDLTAKAGRTKNGWNKILGSTILAAKHGCNYVWIDTCCIDKTSSAELSEAINSMFRWYRKCKVCFAYLEDVSVERKVIEIIEIESDSEAGTAPPCSPPAHSGFPASRWFKRGWTLQELIAPKTVYLYDSSWNEIGEKRQLWREISRITGISYDVLHDYRSLYTKSIARRMSWASSRVTTKIEDIAYCLMGIFNVNMPLLYGEGERAFVRLQEEIMRSSYDHSLFAWNHHFPNTLFGSSNMEVDWPLLGVGLLAPHPVAFNESADIIPHTIRTEPYAITNRGLRIHLRLLKKDPRRGGVFTYFALLQCRYTNSFDAAIAIPIAQMSPFKVSGSKDDFYRSPDQNFIEVKYSQAAPLEKEDVYFLAAGPLFLRKSSHASHRFWLRNYGQDLGVRLHKARYCEYSIATLNSDDASCIWNYENKSMTWAEDWRGSRAALFFSKMDGPAFVVIVTFRSLADQGGQIGMDVHFKLVKEYAKEVSRELLRQVVLEEILHEDFPNDQGFQPAEAQKVLPFEDRFMTIRVKNEMVFDENLFILDLLFSGVKRGTSETAPESDQKGPNRVQKYKKKSIIQGRE